MSGYIPRERERLSREQWIAMILAVIAAVIMLFIAVYASKVVSGWVGVIGRIPPAAPLMFVLGSNLLIQTSQGTHDRPVGKWIGRNRRLIAAFFYLFGIVMIALPFVFN